MTRESGEHEGSDRFLDDLRLTRRSAMILLGVSAAGVGSAAAGEGDDVPTEVGGEALASHAQDASAPTREWNQHVDAQFHDLRDVGDLSARSADLENIYTAARDAEVVVWQEKSGIYNVDTDDRTLFRTMDFTEAVQGAIDEGLTADREEQETVLVAASGQMGPHEWDGDVEAIDIPSHTEVDFRGTIYVRDTGEALVRPLRIKDAHNITIPQVKIDGNFRTATWFKSVRNLRMGYVEMHTDEEDLISGTGLGMRIDGGRDVLEEMKPSEDIQIDTVYAEGLAGHAVETYNVGRIQLGKVIANDIGNYDGTGGCGVLLNATWDATVGAVIGKDIDVGGGYAAFRVANDAHDVTCDQVVCHGGARGVFGVSACHDITIGEVNIRETNVNGVLIQDCQRVTIEGGVVRNCVGEAIRIDSRDSQTHPPAEAVNVSNVNVEDTRDEPKQTYGIRVTGPGTTANRITNNDVRGGGTSANMAVFSPDSIVKDNLGGGVASGTVKLTTGKSPAAVVKNVSKAGNDTLELRSKVRSAPDGAFGYDHHFEWTGSQWNLVFEWVTDPGSDLDVHYLVDRAAANLGGVPVGEIPGIQQNELVDGATYKVTQAHNQENILMTVQGAAKGNLAAGSKVWTQTDEAADVGQQWKFTKLSEDENRWRIDVANTDKKLTLSAKNGQGGWVIVDEWANRDTQKWEVREVEGGYMLVSVANGMAVDVFGVDTGPEQQIGLWTASDGAPNQTHILMPVSGDDGQQGQQGQQNQQGQQDQQDKQGKQEFPFKTTPGVVESFEEGPDRLDAYNGATKFYQITDAISTTDGSYSLWGNGTKSGGGSTGIEDERLVTTDLERSPAPGTKFRADIGWHNNGQNACIAFGANETTKPSEGDAFPYHFIRFYEDGEDDYELHMYTRTGDKPIGTGITVEKRKLYAVIVDWRKDGSATVTVKDPENDTELVSVDVPKEDFGGGTDWGDGGIGTRGTGRLDNVRILENRRD